MSGGGRVRVRDDTGSAVVESALVTTVLLVLFLGILQVGLALHVRSTLAAAASEGARHGAVAGRTHAEAAQRTRQVAGSALAPTVVDDVTVDEVRLDGAPVVVVRVTGRLPVLGPWGPSGRLRATGRALREGDWS